MAPNSSVNTGWEATVSGDLKWEGNLDVLTNAPDPLTEAFPEDPYELIRKSDPTDHVFIDVFENEDGFQVMSLSGCLTQ